MCGINGFTFLDPDKLRGMHERTRHRGPDDEGFFENQEVSLAHNRLSIIDLSSTGHQPMTTPDGRYTIVFNGEIYNYRDIKKDLVGLGETFRGSSDTEVLLAAFARWGEKSFTRLNGIFAFAIWDAHDKRLTLARDHIGVKPLYYHWDGRRLIFSSEMKALLVHDVPRDIDPVSLNLYFRLLYVPAPRTMFTSIKKLSAGHVATYHQGRFDVRPWWTLQEGSPVRRYEDAVEGVRQRVRTAVERQLVSDRPLGVFLSGGIDSTSLLGVMRDLQGSEQIKTFSVGYETEVDSQKYNADANLAAKSAAFFGTDHHAFTISAHDVADCFDKVIWHMDEPISNHVQPSTFLLAAASKPTITVALGGDGGDELFGGYPRYWYLSWLARMDQSVNRLGGLRQTWTSIVKQLASSERWRKLQTSPGAERWLSFVAQKEEDVTNILNPSCNDPSVTRSAFSDFFSPPWQDATNHYLAADIVNWLPDESLMRTDKLTMAHGLEERVPLLDPDLVSYAMSIPSRFKVGTRTQGKRVFVDAMRPYLPAHVLDQEKRAWMSPAAKWIRGPLLPFVRERLSPDALRDLDGMIQISNIEKILEQHLSKQRYGLHAIWALLTFESWYRQYVRS